MSCEICKYTDNKMKSYFIDQLKKGNPFFSVTLIAFVLLTADLLLLTCFWSFYVLHNLFKQGRYYKSTMYLVRSFRYVDEEEYQNNARKAEYHTTMWYKNIFLLALCICENAAGVCIIVSLVMGSYSTPPAVYGNSSSNSCSYTLGEERMNFMIALDSLCLLVPIGIVNGLLVYLSVRNAFYGKSYRRLVHRAVCVPLKVSAVSILALIPNTITVIASEVLLSACLAHETVYYFILSRELAQLLRARNLDLKHETETADRYKQAEQAVDSFVLFTKLNQLGGVLIQLSVLLNSANRVTQVILETGCLTTPATIRNAYRVTEILYYPTVLSLFASSILFLAPYTLVTLRYTQMLCKKRRQPVYKPLMRPLIE